LGKKKHNWGVEEELWSPQLVQLKEGNCSCDHVLAWSLPNSMRFFFVSNTFTIPELEASTPLPLLVELHQPFSCNHSLRKENWVWTQRDNWVFILNSSNPQEVVLNWFNARDDLYFQVFLPNWTFLDKVLKVTFLSHLNKERYSEHLLYLYVSLDVTKRLHTNLRL